VTGTPGWQLRTAGRLTYYELTAIPVRLLFITRRGGASTGAFDGLNLSPDVGDNPQDVDENWTRVRAALRGRPIVTLRQVHSSTVLSIPSGRIPARLLEGDACFTGAAGPALGVRVADCLPVYVFAPDGRCRAIAHCGWRGTAGRIAGRLCRRLTRAFGVPLPDLRFAFGPCVCPGCYPVGEEVQRAFRNLPAADSFLSPVSGHARPTWNLDLRAANRALLRGMGLTEVAPLDLCSKENEGLLYSARRESPTGRNLALITAA
jgi:YfiH family protein